jgi:hypothetical protein
VSIQAIAWVLEHSEAKLADRLVLLAIANHADAQGWNAWPSVDQIAKEARVGRSTVFECLPRLVERGELEITPGGRGPRSTNSYRIQMQGSGNQTLQGSGSQTLRVRNPEKRVQPVNHKPSLSRPEPSRAPTREAPTEDPRNITDADRQRGKEAVARLREGLGR